MNLLAENKNTMVLFILLILAAILFIPGTGVLFALAIVLIILIANRKNNILRSIGFFHPGNIWKLLLVCMFTGLLIQLVDSFLIEPLVNAITGKKVDLSQFDAVKGNTVNFLLALLLGWVVGGLIEEVIFRGYLVTRLKNLLGESIHSLFIILLITSLPFGLAHMYQGWAGVISTTLIALLLGIVFIRSGYNLWYPILVHGFVNTFGFSLIYLDIHAPRFF